MIGNPLKELLIRLKELEPARLAEGVRAVLIGLVGLGWLTIDDALINSIATGATLVISGILTVFVRNRVTPVAKLDHDGS